MNWSSTLGIIFSYVMALCKITVQTLNLKNPIMPTKIEMHQN